MPGFCWWLVEMSGRPGVGKTVAADEVRAGNWQWNYILLGKVKRCSGTCCMVIPLALTSVATLSL